MLEDDLAFVAAATGATSVVRGERIQSLWAGYGEIVRVHLSGAARATAVVKRVSAPAHATNKSSRDTIPHARKHRLYEVEAAFYQTYAARCDDECRVPALLGCRPTPGAWLFVLEDLQSAGFVERRHSLDAATLDACIAWLAAFHARFLNEPPRGLWPIGTYWHLDTRRDELPNIRDRALRDDASEIDSRLAAAEYQTLVHGDAKPANFCFTRDPHRPAVAAVDFQYVGAGCGMKDLAYLLYERADRPARAEEPRWLDRYFIRFREALARRQASGAGAGADADLDALEREWRALYPVAQADFARFLAGWRAG